MRNQGLDVIAHVFSESGCSYSEGEYSISLASVGSFDIDYFDDFKEAVDNWVMENEGDLKSDTTYQLFMTQVHEVGGAGAVHSRYFDVLDVSYLEWF